jgi:uncharacterized protein (DUF885 family)
VYDTQRQLERESQLLKAELAALKQQLRSWSNTTQQLLEGLKHAGDLEHYVAVLSREAAALAKVLTAAAAAEAQGQAAAAATAATASQAELEVSTAAAGGATVGSDQEAAAQSPSEASAASSEVQAAAESLSHLKESAARPELPVSKRASR